MEDTPAPPDLTAARQAYILAILMHAARGSIAQRTKAINNLNAVGYTDDEISEALHAETVRIEAVQSLLFTDHPRPQT